jgi:hypothetical protein
MRKTPWRDWHRWQLTLTPPSPSLHANRINDRPTSEADGIRHDLVARIRQQIADGTYETEEKWRRAEEALLRRIEETV